MAKNPWIFQQRAAIQKAYNRALEFYSPRTALAKVRQLVQAPARDFQILPGWNGTRAGLKGDRSRHPLIISIRQLRIKRTGLTPGDSAPARNLQIRNHAHRGVSPTKNEGDDGA
jgi:hypothetical protein